MYMCAKGMAKTKRQRHGLTMRSSPLQPCKWQLTGIGYNTAAQRTLDSQLCSQTYYAPVSHARPSARNPCT